MNHSHSVLESLTCVIQRTPYLIPPVDTTHILHNLIFPNVVIFHLLYPTLKYTSRLFLPKTFTQAMPTTGEPKHLPMQCA